MILNRLSFQDKGCAWTWTDARKRHKMGLSLKKSRDQSSWSMWIWQRDGVGFWQDANSLCSHWCTYHLFTSTSRVQNSETAPAPLYVDNLPGKSWFTFRLDVLLLSWCWGCYYIPLFFDLIFFSFVNSILAMYLWLFVRIWSVPLPSTRAWLRHVTAKMSVWAPFVVCRHADVGHTRLSFHTQKRSDLKAWIIFLKHP